jgi:hypothetical protein
MGGNDVVYNGLMVPSPCDGRARIRIDDEKP